MLKEREQMLEAASELEQAAEALGRAFHKYHAAYGVVSRAAHPSANRQLTLETTVGAPVLNSLLVQRLRALGLGAMLAQGRTPGVVSSVAAPLQSKIRAQVK